MKREEPKYRDVTCEVCGKVFRTHFSRSKYCSDECRKIAKRDSIHSWRMENETEVNEKNKNWMRKKRRKKDNSELPIYIDPNENLEKIAQQYDTKYGDYQREKTLAMIPKIDVAGIISGFNKQEGERKNEIHV